MRGSCAEKTKQRSTCFSKAVVLNRRMGSALPDDLQELPAVGKIFAVGKDLDQFGFCNCRPGCVEN